MAGVILAIVLAVSTLGVGTAYASQSSLPGDALYPLKLATEQAGMVLSPDGAARVERALSFANKRMREMEALAQKGRSQDLELAVEQYGYALNMTLSMIEQAADEGLADFEEKSCAILMTPSSSDSSDFDEIKVKAGPGGARFFLIAARPLQEPVAWGGPIVMNTQEELNLAFSELQSETFIKHDKPLEL